MGLGTGGEERLILQKLEDLWPKALPRRTVKGGGKVERRELVFPLWGRVKRFLVSDLLRTYPIGIGSFFSKALSWDQDILWYWIGLITETLLLNRSDLKEFKMEVNYPLGICADVGDFYASAFPSRRASLEKIKLCHFHKQIKCWVTNHIVIPCNRWNKLSKQKIQKIIF